jgi:hypothetical protein
VKTKNKLIYFVLMLLIAAVIISPAFAEDEIGSIDIKHIQTPDKVNTSIGELNFIDGAPLPETAEKVYDYLDTMRGVDVFLKGMAGASIQGLMDGGRVLGQTESHHVLYFDKLMDSKSKFLTANTSTMYIFATIDTKKDGPVVLELPTGVLGAFNDAWFRYVEDIGPFGPDKGKGGKYLVLPPDYEGNIPDGYFVVKPKTYRTWMMMRGSIAKGLEAAAANAQQTKIYPLAKKDNPPQTKFISGSGKDFNTIHTNDYTFYEHLNEVIQYEPLEMLDVETRGLFASIGMQKGKEFAPNQRMQKILSDAVAIANAAARSIVWYPRIEGSVDNLSGIKVYPDNPDSNWIMAWVDKNVFFNGKDKRTMNSDARVMFHYPYTVVTPAMAVTIPGKGSDYGIAYVDSAKQPFDGSKTYRLYLPPDPPANDFWALTMYDPQTRSMLQTEQPLPTLGSQSEGIKQNEDGSYDIYFAPNAPKGFEKNWLATVPGKSWFVALRLYGPEQVWIDKTWRPGEIELVK